MKRVLALVMLIAGNCNCYAHECTQQDKAESLVDSLYTWSDISTFQKRYASCDEGSISEGVTESVVTLLSKKWSTVAELQALINRNPMLEPWVLEHINTTANDQDLESIVVSAQKKCPSDSQRLCKRIETAASQALQELSE
ncbi:hypothetical protein [Atlantibacter sp.]|uniref:hypothetical protein n=1 Tax=Atlantibacter sp. TaxID=1903473 RepID=UPI0028A7700B|nr:hypothetical protein [Atlantibacter sp.]